MSRSFGIIMAGVISGLVAVTTTFLGLGGTAIGAVLGAIIYQVLSVFIKEPLENVNLKKAENEFVFALPLIIIAIILLVFILAYFNTVFFDYYDILREVTGNNLLRLIGIGLIMMGSYPLIQSKNIDKKYGGIILILGLILLFRGLIDIDYKLFNFYDLMIGEFDLLLPLSVFLVLLGLILKLLFDSIKLYRLRNKRSSIDEVDNENIQGTEKINSSKTSTISKNKEIINNINFNKSNSDYKADDKNKK